MSVVLCDTKYKVTDESIRVAWEEYFIVTKNYLYKVCNLIKFKLLHNTIFLLG